MRAAAGQPRAATGRPSREVPNRRRSEAGARRLSVPLRAAVQAGDGGRPRVVDGRVVDSIRETWLLEDRWWTSRPIRRRYWEVVTTCGRDEVVFHDLRSGRWWRQR